MQTTITKYSSHRSRETLQYPLKLLIGQLKMAHEGQQGNCSKIVRKLAVKNVIKLGLSKKQKISQIGNIIKG